jgi:hypothetical protein
LHCSSSRESHLEVPFSDFVICFFRHTNQTASPPLPFFFPNLPKTPVKSPTGSENGGSTDENIKAKNKYQPHMAAANPNALPAYHIFISQSKYEIWGFKGLELTICKLPAFAPPWADWKKAPVRRERIR